jgi:hypothetical protein
MAMGGVMPQQPVANVPPPGFGGPGASGAAADLIRNLLTTPRPGGLAGLRGAQTATQQTRPNFSEGIAGVASKAEERGVKVYQEREHYNEWEFVYDYRQDASMAGVMGMGGPAGNLNPAQPGLGPSNTLQVDPSRTVPVPGVAGFPGMMPGGDQQPGGALPFAQPAPAPPLPGDPAATTPYGQQPGQPATNSPTGARTPNRRNSQRRGSPPLPGMPIYPGANPNQQILTPGAIPPYGVPGQQPAPTDPNQAAPGGNQQQP